MYSPPQNFVYVFTNLFLQLIGSQMIFPDFIYFYVYQNKTVVCLNNICIKVDSFPHTYTGKHEHPIKLCELTSPELQWSRQVLDIELNFIKFSKILIKVILFVSTWKTYKNASLS